MNDGDPESDRVPSCAIGPGSGGTTCGGCAECQGPAFLGRKTFAEGYRPYSERTPEEFVPPVTITAASTDPRLAELGAGTFPAQTRETPKEKASVKVNFDQLIPMPKGSEEAVTYKQVVVNNLRQWGRPQGQETRDGKLRRARLAERIDAAGEVELSTEEKNDILDMAELILPPFTFAKLYDLLDAANTGK